MLAKLLLSFVYFFLLTSQQTTVTLYSDLSGGSYSGWTFSDTGLSVGTSVCGTYTVLGGQSINSGLGLSPEGIKKSYTLTQNYADITVTFDFLRIDKWDTGEKLILVINGQYFTYDIDTFVFSVAANLCGSTTQQNPVQSFTATVSVPCGTTSLDLQFAATTKYNKLFRDESYGIMNLVITATTCPNGCTCCKNPANSYKCQSCDNTNQYVLSATFVCTLCDVSCNLCQYSTTNCIACAGGYYRETNGGSCILACPNYYRQSGSSCDRCEDPFCMQCPAATSTCTQCNSTSYLLTATNKCTVKCPDRYYPNNFFRQCLACTDANCLTCGSGVAVCTRCSNSYFVHPTLKTCVAACPSGYKSNSLTGQCDACTSSNCLSCPNDVDICTSCSATKYLLNGACVGACPNSYATSVLSNECAPCSDRNCQDCTKDSLICVQCLTNFYFYKQSQTCLASCPNGYQSNSVSRSCKQCQDSNCLSCQFSTQVCDSCASGTYRDVNGACQDSCPSGYWTNTSSRSCVACSDSFCSSCPSNIYRCEACKSGYFYHATLHYCLKNVCGDGRRTFLTIGGDETCDDGNTQDGDGCSSTCQDEVGYYCSGGDDTHIDTCISYPNTYSSPNMTIYYAKFKADEFVMYFDMNVVFTADLTDLFFIDIVNDQGYEVFSSYDISQLDAEAGYYTRLLIKFNFNQTFSNLTMDIRVVDRSYIQNAGSGIYTATSSLSMEYISYEYDMQSKLDAAARFEPVSNGFLVYSIFSFLIISAAVVSAFVEFLTGDFILFFNFMDTLQEISYLQLMNLQIPLNSHPYLGEYDVGRYNFMWNYFKYLDITPDQWYYSPPGFVRYDMPTLFFYNVGRMLFMWSVTVAFYLIALILSKVLYKEIRFFRRVRENAGEYFFNLYRSTVVEFVLSTVLQLSNISFDVWYVGFSSALAILFTIPLYTSPGIVMAGMAQNRIKIRNELVRNDMYFMYRELKSENFWSRNFWVIYLAKRIVYGTLLGTLGFSPTVNISLCTVVIVAEYAYFWTIFPFKDLTKTYKMIFMRTMVLLMYLMNLGIQVSSIKTSVYSSFNFGWATIVLMQLFVFTEIVVTWIYIYKNAGPKKFTGKARASTFNSLVGLFEGPSGKKVSPMPKAKKISKSAFKLDESELDAMN